MDFFRNFNSLSAAVGIKNEKLAGEVPPIPPPVVVLEVQGVSFGTSKLSDGGECDCFPMVDDLRI